MYEVGTFVRSQMTTVVFIHLLVLCPVPPLLMAGFVLVCVIFVTMTLLRNLRANVNIPVDDFNISLPQVDKLCRETKTVSTTTKIRIK